MGPLAYGNAVVMVYLLKFFASDIKKSFIFCKNNKNYSELFKDTLNKNFGSITFTMSKD